MMLESRKPLTYRWPGGEVHFEPGIPQKLDDERARRLLASAIGKVHVVGPMSPDWLGAWRVITDVIKDLSRQQNSLKLLDAIITQLDDAFLEGNWTAFCQGLWGVRLFVLNRERR